MRGQHYRLVVAYLVAASVAVSFSPSLAAGPQQESVQEPLRLLGSLLGGERKLTFPDAPKHLEFESWTLQSWIAQDADRSWPLLILTLTTRVTNVGGKGWTQKQEYSVPVDMLAADVQRRVRDGLYTRLLVSCVDGRRCIESSVQQMNVQQRKSGRQAVFALNALGQKQSTLEFGLIDATVADRAAAALLAAIKAAGGKAPE